MNIINILCKPLIVKIISLADYVLKRPRLDIDLENDPACLYNRKSLGISAQQDIPSPIPVPYVKNDFEFTWNYTLRIKNNSSKTAYNIKMEKIYVGQKDYLEKLDPLQSLKDGETVALKYILRHEQSMTSSEANSYQRMVPNHINKLEVIISYKNEAGKKFYTRFVRIDKFKKIHHPLGKPKELHNLVYERRFNKRVI
ncbi:MAG: hypothetical protein MJA30_08180 [Cytophagales bacterium]|nr:hypothetical protein [Cytophagales bacterium]